MTRQNILADYEVENGVIQTPGKFQGQMLYVPFVWDKYNNGEGEFGERNEKGYVVVPITNPDRIEFPELHGVEQVVLEEDEEGFVNELPF